MIFGGFFLATKSGTVQLHTFFFGLLFKGAES